MVIQWVLTVNGIGPWVGRNCGRKIGYWVRSVFSWTVRTLNKTKEMIIGKAKSNNTPYLEIDGKLIERVSEFKILGLQLSNNLYWNCNIDLICNKMSCKLYFLKLLKWFGLSIEDLHYFHITVIRLISVCMHCLESQPYHCIKWPTGILSKRSTTNHLWWQNYRNALS